MAGPQEPRTARVFIETGTDAGTAGRCRDGLPCDGYENLFVTDASVFPTNIWANCQATVMAMSHHAASFVATDA